ncbi:MAG: hypothetical protein COA99_05310 [Moraxellaceae bacterium]|nr:MAG: hypothetical protein COA99_05310 [Moraxellaceae bacterium]
MTKTKQTLIANLRYSLLILLLFSNASYGITAAEIAQRQKEFHVKALFLYNFANFVEWPDDAFPTQTSDLRMCLYGSVPFGGFLDTVNGTRIKDRHLRILRTADVHDIKAGCHILFVGTDRLDLIQELFANIDHLFVLSIGNVKGFSQKGGIVNILRTRDRQKFEINLGRAIENGLLIDSDLLNLARIINTR